MMPNREQIKGHWNEVKGRLQEHWGQLTDDDLQRAEGSAERLVGVVQQKTGATKNEIEKFLDGLFGQSVSDQASEAVHQYADAAQQAASEAAVYARDHYRRLASQTEDYSAKMVDTVRSRPAESLAIAFGVGVAAGALLFFGSKK
ncbi:hypothetical protein K227x_02050 [Rubripirellula lacrimiformis]|uniref:CsbD-like domain-containing protein n=1 Tax=Rubripirellula lacrimiformis TaxID=1930273 RepID=A0A517N3Y7_9BACT|nr:CsbD family protein [Rubripirellula lacrimiformis]QDT01836.1 hypothetical protein K227x_02050 [Rubripirellula lacrimiformis]